MKLTDFFKKVTTPTGKTEPLQVENEINEQIVHILDEHENCYTQSYMCCRDEEYLKLQLNR